MRSPDDNRRANIAERSAWYSAARAAMQGLGTHYVRLQQLLYILRSSLCQGQRAQPKERGYLSEVSGLLERGYKEITLLGQNVNSYGKDIYQTYDFADLLEDICQIEGDYRLRFMTSHPKDASFKLIDTIQRHSQIAKQFHLPIQSGSDEILNKMNRRYSKADYERLIDYMRGKMPGIAITSDIIVGFPGEREEDFEQTLNVIREVKYDNIFSFIFSPRSGTPAAEMTNQIPDEIKKERFARLLSLQSQISKEKNAAYLDTAVRVLVEGRSKTDPNMLTGRNEKNRLVHFKGKDELIGQFATIKITKADTYALMGVLDEGKEDRI